MKKMEQKVGLESGLLLTKANIFIVSDRAPDPLQNATQEHCSVPPRLFLSTVHLHRAGALPEWIFNGHG